MDLNFFKGNFTGWLQYEYSDPPELGFSIKDLRKYRVEYSSGPWSLKFGDMYDHIKDWTVFAIFVFLFIFRLICIVLILMNILVNQTEDAV